MANEENFGAVRPNRIAVLVEEAGVSKAKLPFLQMFVLALLAGAFIGFGGAAYTVAMTGVDATYGPARLLGGLVFSLGLILVVVGGAELFTGNALMVMAAVDRKISAREMIRSWTVVYLGNLVGAASLALLFGFTGVIDGPVANTAVSIAKSKATLEPVEGFIRGVLCNALVCLAIWLTFAARTVAGKVLAIIWPISAFVMLGLEHSVANMYFFPQAWLVASEVSAVDVATNLAVVTLGNIAGGAGGVALAYRYAFLGGR